MLSAGIDLSGNSDVGEQEFMGLVICTDDKKNSIVKNLGRNDIHMREIRDRNIQNTIISKLNFNDEESIAFCIVIDKGNIIKKFKQKRKAKQKKISNNKILRTYNRLLMYHLQERISNFLNKCNYVLSDITFECDSDCVGFLKDNGLKYADAGETHMLSDIVAWANQRNNEPEGVVEINLADIIKTELERKLL